MASQQPRSVTKYLVAKSFIEPIGWNNNKCTYKCLCPTCVNSFKENFQGLEDEIYQHWKSFGYIKKTESNKELVLEERIQEITQKLKKTKSRDGLLDELDKETEKAVKKNHSSPDLEKLRIEEQKVNTWRDIVKKNESDIADGKGGILNEEQKSEVLKKEHTKKKIKKISSTHSLQMTSVNSQQNFHPLEVPSQINDGNIYYGRMSRQTTPVQQMYESQENSQGYQISRQTTPIQHDSHECQNYNHLQVFQGETFYYQPRFSRLPNGMVKINYTPIFVRKEGNLYDFLTGQFIGMCDDS